VIKNYIQPPKKTISKTVFSSAVTGKLYNTKEAVIEDFRARYLKSMTLVEVQNQNRFQLEDSFLNLIQNHLQEEKIATFVETLAEDATFHRYVTKWVEAE